MDEDRRTDKGADEQSRTAAKYRICAAGRESEQRVRNQMNVTD